MINSKELDLDVYKEIIDGSVNPVACVQIVDYDDGRAIRFAMLNDAFAQLFGESAEGMCENVIKLSDMLEISPNDPITKAILAVYNTGERYQKIMELTDVGRKYSFNAFEVRDDIICLILTDVTEYENARKEAQDKLNTVSNTCEKLKYDIDLLNAGKKQAEYNHKIHEIVANASCDGFYYKNYSSNLFYASDSWYDLFTVDGVKPFDSKNIINAVSDLDVFEFSRWREKAIMYHKESMTCEFRLCDNVTYVEANYRFIYDNDNKLVEEIGFFKDITTVKLQKEELAYKAYYDIATGLINRTYFTKLLDEELVKAKSEDVAVYVIYIDIDDFKNINDSIGYKLADDFIIKFAMMLKSYENATTRIARFDSDEFVIMMYDGTRYAAQNIAVDIKKRLANPVVLSNGMRQRMTVSIGIAQYPEGGHNAVDLIGNADIALHRVKENGKNDILFFDERMLEQFLMKIDMENTIKSALDDDKFVLYYQPQYYTSSRKMRGVEALIRMKDEVLGFISPMQFIPLAEKNGTIVEIGEWVLRRAFEDYCAWREAYDFDGILSINISPIQFKQITFESTLYSLVREYRLKPQQVEIEITESVFVDDEFQIIEMIKRIRNNGIRISIDDFGTGYSSLSYLQNIPIDTLKIDKRFIEYIGEQSTSDIITSSLIEMVQKLGVEIIAEGVETQAQFDFLKKINCDDIQGFYLARPMTAESMRAVIREEKC